MWNENKFFYFTTLDSVSLYSSCIKKEDRPPSQPHNILITIHYNIKIGVNAYGGWISKCLLEMQKEKVLVPFFPISNSTIKTKLPLKIPTSHFKMGEKSNVTCTR